MDLLHFEIERGHREIGSASFDNFNPPIARPDALAKKRINAL
jgi:hypothetical protein